MEKKKTQDWYFLVTGIMCYSGCGLSLENAFAACLAEAKQKGLVAEDTCLTLDTEPKALGIQRLQIRLESSALPPDLRAFGHALEQSLDDLGFEILGAAPSRKPQDKLADLKNLLVNAGSLCLITSLWLCFPPSLALSFALTAAMVLSTGFSARHHLRNVLRDWRSAKPWQMSTGISLGWGLSMLHCLYHLYSMPLLMHFAMLSMSILMPIGLMMMINFMDSIQSWLREQSVNIELQGLSDLIPSTDHCYEVQSLDATAINALETALSQSPTGPISIRLEKSKTQSLSRDKLKSKMLISIPRGASFPVDCQLLSANALVDLAIMTGETQQQKLQGARIPAGAINLGAELIAYTCSDSYHSSLNQLLLRSARKTGRAEKKTTEAVPKLYLGLLALGSILAIGLPWALGFASIPLLLENTLGLLFAICPCTVMIAESLPKLLAQYQLQKAGLVLRSEDLLFSDSGLKTLVLDKTGTLTTGVAQVQQTDPFDRGLWQRIYLLEKAAGGSHPIALALKQYYERQIGQEPLIQTLKDPELDPGFRGLAAEVQGMRLCIGSASYLADLGIAIPEGLPPLQGNQTRVFIAEDGHYQGAIILQQQLRPGIVAQLHLAKQQGIELQLLTGDSKEASQQFLSALPGLFSQVHAEKTPAQKEALLKGLNPVGLCYVGDGLNDAAAAAIVSERGGLSCSMSKEDKSAFFTDIRLNGKLDYLLSQAKIAELLKSNRLQNHASLCCAFLSYLGSMLFCCSQGLAVPMLLPVAIMAASSLFVLLNAYRVPGLVAKALEPGKATPTTPLFASRELNQDKSPTAKTRPKLSPLVNAGIDGHSRPQTSLINNRKGRISPIDNQEKGDTISTRMI